MQSLAHDHSPLSTEGMTLHFTPPAEQHHHYASAALEQWQPYPEAIKAAFRDDNDRRKIEQGTAIDPSKRTTIFCSFENPLGRAGGIFPVANMLPAALQDMDEKVIRLSPLHTGISTYPPALNDLRSIGDRWTAHGEGGAPRDRFEKVAEVLVPFLDQKHKVSIIKLTTPDGKEWYLCRCPTFFKADGGDAGRDPYFYRNPGGHDLREPSLVRDALFWCALAPYAAKAIGLEDNLIFQAHDWQSAGISLTVLEALVGNVLNSAGTTAVAHNVYDHYCSSEMLSAISMRTADRFYPPLSADDVRRETFWSRFGPLFTGPLITVSVPYSFDLRSDPQQFVNLGAHLQGVLKLAGTVGVVGIGHGPFIDPGNRILTDELLDAATRSTDTLPLVREKLRERANLIRVIRELPKGSYLGGLDLSGQDVLAEDRAVSADMTLPMPIILAGGRIEPKQKGWDVLARAILNLPRGRALFVISLMNSDPQNEPFVELWREVARKRAGEVIFLPNGLPPDKFVALQAGSTIMACPSMFEPFGSGSEGLINGCLLLARETGGLQSQVVGYRFHERHANGFTYSELWDAGPEDTAREWKAIYDARTPDKRLTSPLYQSQITALTNCLIDAINVCESPRVYGRLLYNVGVGARGLSWNMACELYKKVFNLSGSGIKFFQGDVAP